MKKTACINILFAPLPRYCTLLVQPSPKLCHLHLVAAAALYLPVPPEKCSKNHPSSCQPCRRHGFWAHPWGNRRLWSTNTNKKCSHFWRNASAIRLFKFPPSTLMLLMLPTRSYRYLEFLHVTVENRSKSLVLKNAGTKAHPNASATLSSTAKVIAMGLRRDG